VKLELFDYHLPQALIAQYPLPRRSASRMLVLDRASGAIAHRRFLDLPSFLRAGDCLVINDTKVIPARLVGRKQKTGARVELLLLEPLEADAWEALAGGKVRLGQRIAFEGGLTAEVAKILGEGRVQVRLQAKRGSPEAALRRAGHVPLPPYIRRPDERLDRRRYQTVYACRPGAVAAPTAGLHFTRRILTGLRERGVSIVALTLHVGLATFQPVRAANVEEHPMGTERYAIPTETAQAVSRTRKQGGRVVAVGTTVVRALESASAGLALRPGSGRTDLYIYPGYQFRVVDALLTNFHLPRSTLLMLVCAFAGREVVLEAYREAVERRYRFYSYGDCMLLLGDSCLFSSRHVPEHPTTCGK